MAEFSPRIDDMKFVLREVVGIDRVAALPGYEDATADLVDAVLEEAGKFGREVLAPLNRVGDETGARCWRTASCARPPASRTPIASSSTAAGTRVPFDPGMRRPGPALAGRDRRAGDLGRRQHVLSRCARC